MVKSRKNRKLRGGDWTSDWYNSAMNFGSSLKNKVAGPSTSSNGSLGFMSSSAPSSGFMSSSPSSSSGFMSPSSSGFMSSSPSSSSGFGQGGKRRRMRGGYHANSPMSLASNAFPFSGEGTTARPQNWVGGRTKKRRRSKRKHTKRRR